MNGSMRTLAAVEGWTPTRRRTGWEHAGGLLALAAAAALWVVVLVGVLAPLGDALGRIGARREPVKAARPCQLGPRALASAATSPALRPCDVGARAGECRDTNVP